MRVHSSATYDEYVARGWWSTDTIDDLLRGHVGSRPDAVALVDPANTVAVTGAGPRRLTWAEVDTAVDALAAAFTGQGLRPGEVVVTQLPNTVDLVLTYLAAWRVGLIVSPYAVQFGGHEIRTLTGRVGAAAVVTHTAVLGRDLAAGFAAERAVLPALRVGFAFGPGVPPGWIALDAAGAGSPTEPPTGSGKPGHRGHANDCVTICWTSGTESAPKGVPRSHALWFPAGYCITDATGLGADDVILSPFPMINMGGFACGVMPWLLTGCRLVAHHPFDLPTFLAQIATERVTLTCAPPSLLMMLLSRPEVLAAADLSSLRWIGSGSAPLQPAMVESFARRHGIEVLNFFGSNEGIALVADPESIPDHRARATYFPRVGVPGAQWSNRVFRGLRTRLVEPASGAEVREAGVVGEMRVGGPTVFAGYWTGGPADTGSFDEHGDYRTGDLFEIACDDVGEPRYYRFVDRLGDIVIRGGQNISAAEVEALITEDPDVLECAVVGEADALLGERLVAVVAAAPGASPDLLSVRRHLGERGVASFKMPERVRVVASLPRNPVGKVDKRSLRRSSPAPA